MMTINLRAADTFTELDVRYVARGMFESRTGKAVDMIGPRGIHLTDRHPSSTRGSTDYQFECDDEALKG